MKLQGYEYNIPLTSPLETSQHNYQYRKGLFIACVTDKTSFWGEAAPLPGFSTVQFHEIKKTFLDIQTEFLEICNSKNPVDAAKSFYCKNNLAPALAFCLDTIAYQIEAENSQKNLRSYLFAQSRSSIPVNALGDLSSKEPVKEAQQAITNGFKTMKYKVGINFESELKTLKQIKSHFPDLIIRVDANRGWSVKEAIDNCKKLAQLDIEYCEEPLKNPAPPDYKNLSEQTALPLAIDESIININHWKNLLPFTSFVVLKPMLLGSFTKILETKQHANNHDNKVIFTTSLESGIGRVVTAALASGLGARHAHGLATGNRLAEDLFSDSDYITDGQFKLPNRRQELQIELKQLQNISSIKLLQ